MTKRIITTEELFTGGKTPDFAVFYNIAYWWMSDMIAKIYKNISNDGNNNQNNSPFLDRFINDGNTSTGSGISDSDYLKLRDYLWKGYLFEKNKSGQELTELDKRLIHKTIAKLVDIRNFHSHVWHDNAGLIFDADLKKWVNDLHSYALEILQKENGREVDDYIKKFDKKQDREPTFFNKVKENYFITPEGREFFLSLFLKRSEISRFMQQRKGCKRNDKPEFKIKHSVYRFYTHRDGATKNRYSIEETAFSELDTDSKTEILQARQIHKMLSYLGDVPEEVIDKKLFPLFLQGKEVNDAELMKGFIEEKNLFSDCKFELLLNKEEKYVKKEMIFSFEDYKFKIRVNSLHKLILDILRDSEREIKFYETLNKFIDFRKEFPEKLDNFARGDETVEEIEEYYSFKLRASDYVRGKLAIIISRYHSNTTIDLVIRREFKELLANEPIELSYYNFYFEEEFKPRAVDRFMIFAVNFIIDRGILTDWKWLLEKFEPEEITKKVENKDSSETKNVVKRIKKYSSTIEDGYRLSLKDNHVLFKLKSKPELVFGIGENAMRNLLLTHFLKNEKSISSIIPKVVADIEKITQASQGSKTIGFDELELLNEKTMPRFLRLMMHDKITMQNETMDHAILKSKERIKSLIEYFTDLENGEIILNRKEINTQLIRCYKYFDWKYPLNNEFKFLRQNEYQLMSIYHYTLAKKDNNKYYLSDLREKLFKDIQKHLPKTLDDLLSTATDLDGLFKSVLKATIKKLYKWNNKLCSMKLQQKKECISKLGIHIPMIPVPDASNKENLNNMSHLPFMLHPALVFKAMGYSMRSDIFKGFRNRRDFSQGLISEYYNYQSYLDFVVELGENKPKQTHKIIGEVNNLKTLDTLIWQMTKVYLTESKFEIFSKITERIKDNFTGDFKINQLNTLNILVYKTDKNSEKPFRVNVMFKQLDDFMLITGKPLNKLAKQLFNRYSTDEELEDVGILKKDGFYEIPYIHIKQEMDRMYHESIIVTHMILAWEKNVIKKIKSSVKQSLIEEAKENGHLPHINFSNICNFAGLNTVETALLSKLRNHALHAKIPDSNWTYRQKLKDITIVKILGITEEKMKKYEKKNDYYEAKALENNK